MKENFKLLKDYEGKRKKVDLIEFEGSKCILKQYDSIIKVKQENEIMNKIANTGYAPTIVQSKDKYLIYNYVEGDNFAEKFKFATMNDDEGMLTFLAKKLCIFMQMFHSVSDGYIIGDIDFNNFIISDDRCVSIDFYEARLGMPNEDVAGIIAYALCNCVGNYYTCFPFVFKVLECYHIKVIDIINELSVALNSEVYFNRIDKDLVMEALLSYEENGSVWKYLKK